MLQERLIDFRIIGVLQWPVLHVCHYADDLPPLCLIGVSGIDENGLPQSIALREKAPDEHFAYQCHGRRAKRVSFSKFAAGNQRYTGRTKVIRADRKITSTRAL